MLNNLNDYSNKEFDKEFEKEVKRIPTSELNEKPESMNKLLEKPKKN